MLYVRFVMQVSLSRSSTRLVLEIEYWWVYYKGKTWKKKERKTRRKYARGTQHVETVREGRKGDLCTRVIEGKDICSSGDMN